MLNRTSVLTLLAALSFAACNGHNQAQPPEETALPAPAADAENSQCSPIETRSPNGADQKPAFTGQTRACRVNSNVAHTVSVVARGLDHPWAVEPLPGGDFLVTEKLGRLSLINARGQVTRISGVPRVDAGGQGGLLDVALSPSFANDRTIFLSFTEPRQGGNGTSVARGVLSADRRTLSNVRIIFRALPTYNNSMHFGSRLAFGRDGTLYITTGERSDANMRRHAQQLDGHLGKVSRINADGSVPKDNPFVGQANARGEVFTLGHRNLQAMTVDAQGRVWTVEHGPRGGDELNLIEKGKNYGWPVVTYGIEYSGRKISGAVTQREGYQQPVYYWDPVIAPSGAQFYTGSAFPAWRGSIFVGGMVAEALVRLQMRNDRVVGEEHLLKDRGKRIRDVREGPDGNLYVVTDENNGELLRIAPRR
jgi:aldose sugar dehydrogenase